VTQLNIELWLDGKIVSALASAPELAAGGVPAATRFPIGGDSITQDASYEVRARAYNMLGWGAYSELASCTTLPVEEEPFNFILLILVLVGVILCLILTAFVVWKSELPKVLAPRLRRRKSKEVELEAYMSSDFMPMEDEDPELTVNPVLQAKIQMAKERERMAKGKRGLGGGTGRAGGLRRLNISLGNKVDSASKQKANARQQIDEFLGVDASQQVIMPPSGESAKQLKKRMDQLQQRNKSNLGSQTALRGARCAVQQTADNPLGACGSGTKVSEKF